MSVKYGDLPKEEYDPIIESEILNYYIPHYIFYACIIVTLVALVIVMGGN